MAGSAPQRRMRIRWQRRSASSLRGLDGGLPFTIRTWNKELDGALFASRVNHLVSLGILGGLGAMLAVTGIFGMASYSVAKRLREFGIRIALGAQRTEVLQAALGKGFASIGPGIWCRPGTGIHYGENDGLQLLTKGTSGDPAGTRRRGPGHGAAWIAGHLDSRFPSTRSRPLDAAARGVTTGVCIVVS